MLRKAQFIIASLGWLFLLSAGAPAQTMPPDLIEKVAAIGRVTAPPQTYALYAPLHEKEPYKGVKVTRDVKYGPHDRNRLDVFTPDNATGGARPVLIFVHGGGFVRGDKKAPNSPFLDNVPLWAARHGIVGVNMTYRLAPQATWPSGPEDMAAAVKWVRENIKAHGGDPARIYLMGWSAGGNHVASYVAFSQYHVVAGSGLAGALLMSASPLDTTVFDMTPYKPYFGDDASKYPPFSPTPGLLKSSVPLMVIYAGLDPPGIERESINLVDALCKQKGCPTKAFLKTHSHISTGAAIGTKDTELSDQMLAFMKVSKPTN